MVVGLDIGTSYIRVAIGAENEEGKLEIVGTSKRKSVGLRNGVIVNIEDAQNAIKEAIELAEEDAGFEVSSCFIGIGGTQVESYNRRGGAAVTKTGTQLHEVTQQHKESAIESANAVRVTMDRELLHVIPQNYIVDGIGGIKDPLHMQASKLDVEVHIVTASKTTIQNVRACINRAGYALDGVMLKTLAASQAVVHEDEKEVGSILIDMGAGTTDVLVLLHDAPICSFSIPVGGNLVTNDISVVKGIPTAVAEKLKVEHGCCWFPSEEDDREVIISGLGGRPPEETTQSALCEIIQPRVEEIFKIVAASVAQRTNLSLLSGNIILTGGGAQMQGIVELATAVFGIDSIRIGIPEKLGGKENYRTPEYATLIGLVLAGNDMSNASAKASYKNKKSSNMSGGSEPKSNFIKKFIDSFF